MSKAFDEVIELLRDRASALEYRSITQPYPKDKELLAAAEQIRKLAKDLRALKKRGQIDKE